MTGSFAGVASNRDLVHTLAYMIAEEEAEQGPAIDCVDTSYCCLPQNGRASHQQEASGDTTYLHRLLLPAYVEM